MSISVFSLTASPTVSTDTSSTTGLNSGTKLLDYLKNFGLLARREVDKRLLFHVLQHSLNPLMRAVRINRSRGSGIPYTANRRLEVLRCRDADASSIVAFHLGGVVIGWGIAHVWLLFVPDGTLLAKAGAEDEILAEPQSLERIGLCKQPENAG